MITASQRSQALSAAYDAWIATLAPVTPDALYAEADPSQYTECAEVMSASDADQMRLFEMQKEALADLEASLVASAAWKDQIRIPAGNQRRSGRWTYTPWALLENLSTPIKINALEPERRRTVEPFDAKSDEYPEYNASLREPNPPKTFYHVAPRGDRDKILADGLDPEGKTWNTGASMGDGDKYEDEWLWEKDDSGGWRQVEYRPEGIYMFADLDEAKAYAAGGGKDIYEIDSAKIGNEIIRDPSDGVNWDYMDDRDKAWVTRYVPPNALTQIVNPDVPPEVALAESRLMPFNRQNLNVRDQEFAKAVAQAAKDLDGVPGAEDVQQSLRDWSNTDWTLFSEDTDIGSNDDVPIARGPRGLWQWKEPLPPEVPVNPDYADWSSQRLVDRLDEIANHHTAPSPKMRRDRASVMQELNDRKAGAKFTPPVKPEPAPTPTVPEPSPSPQSVVLLQHPEADKPSIASRNSRGQIIVTTPDGETHTHQSRKNATHAVVRRNKTGYGSKKYYVSLAGSEDLARREANVQKGDRSHIEIVRIGAVPTPTPVPAPTPAPVVPGPDPSTGEPKEGDIVTAYTVGRTAKGLPALVEVGRAEPSRGDKPGWTIWGWRVDKNGKRTGTDTRPYFVPAPEPDLPTPDPVSQVRQKVISGLVPVDEALADKTLTKDQRNALNFLQANPDGLAAGFLSERIHGGEGTPAMLDAVMKPLEAKKYVAPWRWDNSTIYLARPGSPTSDPSVKDVVNAYAWGGLGIQNGMEVNGNLRTKGYKDLSKPHKEFVDRLDEAIAQADASLPLTVVRTIGDSEVAARVSALKVGDVFEDPGYMSTTTDEDVLNDFVVDEDARVDFVIDLAKGDARLSVDDYTDDDAFKQSEYLLPRGTRLEITEIEDGPDGRIVYARIAKDQPKKALHVAPPEIPRLTEAQDREREMELGDSTTPGNTWRPTIQDSAYRGDPRGFGMANDEELRPEVEALHTLFRDNMNGSQVDRSMNLVMYDAIDLARKADMPQIAKLLEVANWGIENGDANVTEDAFNQLLWTARTTELLQTQAHANFIGGFGSVSTGAAYQRAVDKHREWTTEMLRSAETLDDLARVLKDSKANIPEAPWKKRVSYHVGPSITERMIDDALVWAEAGKVSGALTKASSVFNDPEWRDALNSLGDKILPDAETPLYEKFGTIPEDRRTPEAVIADIGKYYGVRTHGSNCVLASNTYELRRRGIDAEPKQAKKGRNAEINQRLWFRNPEHHTVNGLKGLQKKNRSAVVYKHIADTYPPGSRGTIRCAWKGLTYGHIWNWERFEDGTVVFFDAQTGKMVPPTSNYWFDMEWKNVQTVRLDNLRLLEDIEVIIEPKAASLSLSDRALLERYQEIRDRMRAMLEADGSAYYSNPEYAALHNESSSIRADLKQIADSYEILHDEVNTLEQLRSQKR